MPRPYSNDLRERAVAAVLTEGLSRHRAAARFGVAPSTVINWVRRHRETGSVAPGQIGGYRPKKIQGEHRDWLIARCRERDFTLNGLVAELAERGLAVDYRTMWTFVHDEGLSYKKRFSRPSRIAPTSRVGGRSGSNIRIGSTRPGWSSSTRPGPRPTWRP